MTGTKHSLKWHGRVRPDLRECIQKEIDKLMAEGLACANDLITHTMELGDRLDGPCVHIWGGGEVFHVQYIAKPKWVSFDERKEHCATRIKTEQKS
jgi:hypothetical protein